MGKFRSMQAKSRQSDKEESAGSDYKAYAAQVANTLNDAVKSNLSHLEEECAVCLDPINVHDAVVTPCLHIFCKGCLVNVLTGKKDIDNKSSSGRSSILQCPDGPCPVCNVTLDASKILRLEQSDGRTTTSYLVDQKQGSKVAAKAVKSEDATNVGHARKVLESAIQGSSSSKQSAIIQELHNVWEETPRSKVLVFSQFLGFLDLLENSFRSSGIPFSRLDGKLSLKERVRVLDEFGRASPERLDETKINDGTKKSNIGSVLLVSMKAGGVGLNLVAASTVFIADPWWNAAVEDQCINRVHRIGQTADKVRVRKFYVFNSVEERIVKLQGRKNAMSREVLCDDEDKTGDGPKGAGMRPTLDDLKILFRED
jgi:DNA repair protein RAD5